MRLVPVLLALAGLCASSGLSAQHLWIEQEGGNAKLYFGAYGENRRETSPGGLDKLPRPEAKLVTLEGTDDLTVRKAGDAFDLGVRISRGQVLIAQETRYPASDERDGDTVSRTVWIPAARFVPDMGPQEVTLALDVFPTRHTGEFKVVFIGNPLPDTKVDVMAASGWRRELTTDAQGLIRIDLPWRGPYAMAVSHTDRRPGQRPGAGGPEKYDVARFATTLTFNQPTGPKPPPPLPRAAATAP